MDSPFKISEVTPKTNSIESVIKGLRQSYSKPQEPAYTKGGFFDTMLNDKTVYSTDYTTKTLADSHEKLNDGTWVPKYETYSPNRDNAKYFAETQTTGDKWSNGLLKFGGKTLSAIAGGTIGTVVGVKDWITTGNLTALYDNDFSRYLNDLDTRMNNSLPNHYTEAEQNAGFFESFGSANFWANDVLGGLSFTVGAIGSELIWGAATGGASLATTGARLGGKFAATSMGKSLAKMVSKESTKKIIVEGSEAMVENALKAGVTTDAIKKFSILGSKAGSLANTTRFALTSAGYESGVEALQFRKEAEDNFYEDFKRKNGREPSEEDTRDFVQKLESASNGLYGYNMALVGSSNLLMLGSMFDIKNPLSSPSKWINKKVFGVGLDKATNTVVKATRAQKVGQKAFNILSPMITEGVIEEGGQAVGSGAAQNWIEASYDPKYTKNSMDLGDAFLDAMDETYTTKEGWKEIGIGALIGALTGGATSLRGKNNFKVAEEEATKMMAFNKDYSPHKMANMLFYANRTQNANQVAEQAEEQGNYTLVEKARRDKAIAQLSYAYNLDYLSETIDDTNLALQAIDEVKLAEERGITLEEAKAEKQQAINDYNSIAKSFKLNRDFAEAYFGDVLKREGLDYTQTTTLKDAVAYELTQGEKSWEFSRDILNAIQDEVKNVVGADQAMALRDIYENANPQLQKELNQVFQDIRENERLLAETEEKRKNVSLIRVSDIDVNRERANTANNLTIELSRLTERKQELENRMNILAESAKLDNPFSNDSSPIISAQDVLRLDTTLANIKTLVDNNPKLQNLLNEYERVNKDLKRYSTLTKQIRNPKLQADGAKGLAKLLLGNGRKLNDITKEFISGLQPAMQQANEMKAVSYISTLLGDNVESIQQAEEVVPNQVVVTPLQQIIINNKEYFSRKGVETEEQLKESFPTQEELERFELLVNKSKYDENFSEYDDVESLESNALTEAEQIELNELYDKLDTWQMLSTFENDGISIADMFEMEAQNQTVPTPIQSEVSTNEFSDMVGESSNKGATYRQENLSQTPDGVQFRSNQGKYTVHNISLNGLLSNINSDDLVIIEEDGEYQALPQAISNDVGTKVRVNYGDQHTILTVVAGGVIEIENEVVFFNNSNYVSNVYSGQKPYSYSFLYLKDSGEMVDTDFNEEGVYNKQAIYNLKKGDTVFFKLDLSNKYNQTLNGQADDFIEKQLEIYIVDQNGNVLGDLKANRDTFGSEGFNMIRKEAFLMYKAGQSGMLSTTSSVNKVMLGTPRFTLNQEGYPINKSFNTDAILDWGYYDGKNFNLKNGVADVRTTFVSQIKRNVPVVIFRIGNQNVAFPVNLVGMSSNNNINLLDILNDQSQPISKQVIKINETLLSKGLSGKFFYRGDSDQNVFKNVETQELSDDFVQAQRDLGSQNITPNILDLDISGLAQSVLSPIDFSNNPLSSPRVAFELSNLGSNVVTREEVREVNPTTQEVEVKPNPSKVTQEANKEVQKVIKQEANQSANNVQKADIERRQGLNGIEEIIFSNPNFKLEGFEIDGNYWNVVTSTDRAKVLVNINGVIVPFYLTTGQAGKGLIPSWYPFFGIGRDGWLNKTDKSDMEAYYERYWGKEVGNIVKSISEELNSFYGTDPSTFSNDGDPNATSRPLSTLADKVEDYINSKLSYTPAINNADARKTLRSNVEQLGKEINAKYNTELEALEKAQPTVSQQPSSKITMKDRGNEVSYSVKPFDQNDTETTQEIKNILEKGDTVFPKGSSGVYEYNGTSLVLIRGNGASTFTDFSKGMEIYKSKFNSEKIQDKKDSIEADSSLVNRAKKQQNKKC